MITEQFKKTTVELVRAALEEDVGPGDITSLGCLEPNLLKAIIIAKSEGVLSGLHPAALAFRLVDSANKFAPRLSDGDRFVKGDLIAEISGLNQTVLVAERVALNFLAHLSGVATFTARFTDKIKGYNCCILDTRKTTPGWRLLEKIAVVHGGGENHRIGLYDMVLIKDNHIASAGSITAAVNKMRAYMDTPDFRLQFKTDAKKILIEVEITDKRELVEAIEAGVDRILLDNQTPEQLKQLVEKARSLNPEIKLEASGNVSLDNVAAIAAAGVDYISIGALTHSAPVADFSMRVVP
ncbi:MAG: carboxylating nicotinate-nucleotide diphosphorylase [candidate division Zixibacteria bacterium]|nr:carboxylating nicotinate-nucleotide diphosphorylase [candidate division Zixibacteria bacterium]